EVLLGAGRVHLLARELVARRLERDAERVQLGPVGVEAAGERLVRHLRVALDVLLDVPCRERSPLGHEERDERELADELVGVVRHAAPRAYLAEPAEGLPASYEHACGRQRATARLVSPEAPR